MTSAVDLIPISETARIAGSPEEVWPLLSDPAVVISCVPGAAITGQRPDGSYEASITVKFGPTTARFSGEATVSYDHSARRCSIDGRGIDQRGASRALLSLLVGIEGSDTSVMSVDGGFHVAGPLETFASAGGIHVARALLAEFATNMAAVVESARGAPAETQPAAPGPASELRFGKLLWRSFVGWLRSLFRRQAP